MTSYRRGTACGGLVVALSSCAQLKDLNLASDGALGVSQSVAEARQRGVFLQQYQPAASSFRALGTEFIIAECWVEKSWQHRGYWYSTTQLARSAPNGWLQPGDTHAGTQRQTLGHGVSQ
jgi:hypothetical protein